MMDAEDFDFVCPHRICHKRQTADAHTIANQGGEINRLKAELRQCGPNDRDSIIEECAKLAEFLDDSVGCSARYAAERIRLLKNNGRRGREAVNADADESPNGRRQGRELHSPASLPGADSQATPDAGSNPAAALPTSAVWIACKDRLPEWANGKYLAWFQDDFAVLPFDVQCGWCWGCGDVMTQEDQKQVTHWAELPACPSHAT